MKNSTNNKRRIIFRYFLFVIIMLAFAGCILFKAFKTTIVYADDWNAKADSILSKVTIIEPERGKILADNGTVIAANMQFYIPRIDWNTPDIKQDTLFKYLPALCDSLAAFDHSLTAEEWNKKLTDSFNEVGKNGKKNSSFRLFKGTITTNELERVKSFPFFNKGKKHSGLYYEISYKRCKPMGNSASRSIGNVGESESRKGIHGISGLEMALDSLLYGVPGQATKTQLTNCIVNTEKVPAVPGYDITTTINIDMQDIVETELYSMCRESEAQWGTAILMEVATGEIKAISNLEWSKPLNDYIEKRNNAVLGYEPGSVMKPISMLVALEDGTVTGPEQSWVTGSSWTYAGRVITDHYGAATLTPTQIIARSSNIGISRITVQKYGDNPDGFRKRLEDLGFFEPFHSGIGGETQPVIAHLGNTSADRVALTRMAFGYSTLIPPLSTLAVYNAIANDGKYVRPHLVKKLSREGEPDSIVPVTYIRDQICSPRNAEYLRQMLHAVVWDDHGTAHKWLKDDKVEIAGKTGTAYTIAGGQYTTTRRFAFCGFFPYSKPKYSCMVLMMGANRGAAACSGMVLKNVALRLYARGMLDNKPSYEEDTDVKGNVVKKGEIPKPTIYATGSKTVEKELGIKHAIIKKAKTHEGGGLPNVRGMSVGEAIRCLEKLGLKVTFRGSGIVESQSISPGTKVARGTSITLTLAH